MLIFYILATDRAPLDPQAITPDMQQSICPTSYHSMEFVAAPIVTEALFQTISYIQRVRETGPTQLPKLALQSSQEIATRGTHPSWYASVLTWFTAHGLQMDKLPPYQYDPNSPHIRLSHVDSNQVIQYDLLQAHIRDTRITPERPLPTKM